ncbi:MAG: M48 family metalloprotease [Desulfobacterales bacterium]|nr:M48 family metalloprotease [Desulfobacterales bacterium]
MTPRIRFALLIPLLAFLGLAGCASTNLQPVTSSDYQPVAEEHRIHRVCEQEQQQLADSEMVYHNQKLSDYLNRVALRVLPDEAQSRIAIEILVINNPYSNAFAYPNAKVYVHTGILARMENEAQLATLLGHEMAHVTHRHLLRERRHLRNKAAGLASFKATLGSVPLVGELSSALGELGTMASVSGYSRDLETEADNIGFEWMVAAGYDPYESPKLFTHLMAEMEAEAQAEPFFFGSHPKLADRQSNYQSLLAAGAYPRGGTVKREIYAKAVAPAIYETARLDLKAGRYAKAEKGLKRYMQIYPRSGRAHYLLGEVYRQRNDGNDIHNALKYLSRATKLNRKHAEVYRSIGIVYMNQQDKQAARRAFRSYLKWAPQAMDREFILDYIRQLEQE